MNLLPLDYYDVDTVLSIFPTVVFAPALVQHPVTMGKGNAQGVSKQALRKSAMNHMGDIHVDPDPTKRKNFRDRQRGTILGGLRALKAPWVS